MDWGEDCSVCVGGPWPGRFALVDEDLLAKAENLSRTGVAGSEYPPAPGENAANQNRHEDQERSSLPASLAPETLEISGRTSLKTSLGLVVVK